MTSLEKRLIENTLKIAKNGDKQGFFFGDAIRLSLYWSIVDTCLDREDRNELIDIMRKDREPLSD